jgi:predicted nuclease of predicted toxin-antitoxin system
MKVLLDANISWKLVNILGPVFGECTHVDLAGLKVPVKDKKIWDYALKNGYIIITKDNDFLDLLESKGFPHKVVLIRKGNNSKRILADLIIEEKQKIEDLQNNEYGLLEIYGPLKLVSKR